MRFTKPVTMREYIRDPNAKVLSRELVFEALTM